MGRRPLRALVDRLFEPRCLLCHESANLPRIDLCRECLDALPWRGMRHADAPRGIDRVRCAFAYASPVDQLIRDFKFRGDLAAGRVLAHLLAAYCRARPDQSQQNSSVRLVPVPLHPSRLVERGFDQSRWLARELASELGCTLEAQLLRRVRATASQTALDPVARRRNLAGAFALGPEVSAPRRPAAASHPTLVLVDDVLTTGATLAEAARTLRAAAGVTRLEAWCVARAGYVEPEPPAKDPASAELTPSI